MIEEEVWSCYQSRDPLTLDRSRCFICMEGGTFRGIKNSINYLCRITKIIGNNIIPKQITAYKPRGKTSLGIPLKRLHETNRNRPHGLIPERMMRRRREA
jgi:hypothetical protein